MPSSLERFTGNTYLSAKEVYEHSHPHSYILIRIVVKIAILCRIINPGYFERKGRLIIHGLHVAKLNQWHIENTEAVLTGLHAQFPTFLTFWHPTMYNATLEQVAQLRDFELKIQRTDPPPSHWMYGRGFPVTPQILDLENVRHRLGLSLIQFGRLITLLLESQNKLLIQVTEEDVQRFHQMLKTLPLAFDPLTKSAQEIFAELWTVHHRAHYLDILQRFAPEGSNCEEILSQIWQRVFTHNSCPCMDWNTHPNQEAFANQVKVQLMTWFTEKYPHCPLQVKNVDAYINKQQTTAAQIELFSDPLLINRAIALPNLHPIATRLADLKVPTREKILQPNLLNKILYLFKNFPPNESEIGWQMMIKLVTQNFDCEEIDFKFDGALKLFKACTTHQDDISLDQELNVFVPLFAKAYRDRQTFNRRDRSFWQAVGSRDTYLHVCYGFIALIDKEALKAGCQAAFT